MDTQESTYKRRASTKSLTVHLLVINSYTRTMHFLVIKVTQDFIHAMRAYTSFEFVLVQLSDRERSGAGKGRTH